jgi:hypothetical protein
MRCRRAAHQRRCNGLSEPEYAALLVPVEQQCLRACKARSGQVRRLAALENCGDSDFVYFAFTINSALAVSDTNIRLPCIRSILTAHSIVGFILNVSVFALSMNMLAGKG